MTPQRLKKHKKFLNKLYNSSSADILNLLKNLKTGQKACICEIIKNIVYKTIPIDVATINLMQKHKKVFNNLCCKKKYKKTFQKGRGFLPVLAFNVLPPALEYIYKHFLKNI